MHSYTYMCVYNLELILQDTVGQSTAAHCHFEGCYASSCLLAVLLIFVGARLHIPQVDITVKSYSDATFITVRLLFRELYILLLHPGQFWCWLCATFERKEGACAGVYVLSSASFHHHFIYFFISQVT